MKTSKNAQQFPSCAEAIACIMASSQLSATTKTGLKSAVVRVVRYANRDLDTTPADPALFRDLMKDWSAARFGVRESSLKCTISQFKRALMEAGIVSEPSQTLSPPWSALDATVRQNWSSKTNGAYWRQMRLRAFMYWCTKHQIEPEAVNDDVIVKFVDGDDRVRVRETPSTREAHLREAWNRASEELLGWPSVRVAQRRPKTDSQPISFDESYLPASLIQELDHYQAAGGFLGQDNLEASNCNYLEWVDLRRRELQEQSAAGQGEVPLTRRKDKLADATLYQHRRYIVMCATALVVHGRKRVEDLRSIADVVCVEGMAALALSIETRRRVGTPRTAYAKQAVKSLISVASRCRVKFSSEDEQTVRELAQAVGAAVEVKDGEITPKNRARLAQFDDPDSFSLLLSVPEAQFEELEKRRRETGVVSDNDARLAADAVAIVIVRAIPVRRRTVGTTKLSNIHRPDRRGASASIVYENWQVKAGTPPTVVLDDGHWKHIDLYLRHYRPVLQGAASSEFLFPAETKSGHMPLGSFATSINRLVHRWTGAQTALHLWRHILATKVAKEHGVAEAKGVLGHVDASRATGHYLDLASYAAGAKLKEITSKGIERGVRIHNARTRRRKAA